MTTRVLLMAAVALAVALALGPADAWSQHSPVSPLPAPTGEVPPEDQPPAGPGTGDSSADVPPAPYVPPAPEVPPEMEWRDSGVLWMGRYVLLVNEVGQFCLPELAECDGG